MWPLRSGRSAADPSRWLVLDVESSGLDPARDRLLAVAAVALHVEGTRARIVLADSFEAVLRQPAETQTPDKANILVHGIGVGAQAEGVDPAQALVGFEAFAAAAPLIGFHAAFDRRLIERAMQTVLGRRLPNAWLDVAEVGAALQPQQASRSLDDWLAAFGIECTQRHRAAADALATAELLLRLLPAARADGTAGFAGLAKLAARRRWLR
jgi:DNA polymerase III subunit epsilon